MFSKPKAYVKMDFNCPLAVSSPDAAVLTDIFTRLLMDYLNEYGKILYLGIFLSDRDFVEKTVCQMEQSSEIGK